QGITGIHRETLIIAPVPPKVLTLNLPPKLLPRVFRIELGQFSQQFFSLLVARHRDSDLHLDNLVPARAVFGSRRHALFAQPKLLSRLRPGRNLKHAPPIDGRHFNLRSQSRFDRGNRHRDVDVVAVAPEKRVLADADADVEIADPAPAQPGIALARDPNALPVAGSGLN